MRVFLSFALLVIVVAAVGCSSDHSTSGLTGPASLTSGAVSATPPTVAPSPALFGKVSNLSASGFTLTTTNGNTYDITTSATTVVRFTGSTSDVASSVLADGEMVTVVGTPTGLPSQAKERATLVVINNGYANQQVISAQ